MKKLVLIDGHSILNRAFYGVPDLSNSAGLHTNAVYGFLNILFKILEEEKPDYLTVAFDVHAPTFRHEIYKEYKGTRKPMPEELREQVPVMKEVLDAMGIKRVEQPGFEADDILGTLARRGEKEGMAVSLVSGDRDLLQIASEHIKIRIPKTKGGKTEIEDYYAADVKAKYQVTPLQFIDMKALMGDTADNIPGVPKVGEKTAAELMVCYGSIENIYAHVEEISKKSIRESLIANRELADLSKVLATINTDSPVEFSFEEAVIGDFYTQEAYVLFKKLEFKNLLGRFEKGVSNEAVTAGFGLISSREEADRIFDQALANSGEIGLAILRNEGNRGELVGISLAFADGKSFLIPREGEISEEYIQGKLAALGGQCRIACPDIKGAYEYLKSRETERFFDIILAAYLLNPLKNDYTAAEYANKQLGLLIPERSQRVRKMTRREAFKEKKAEFTEYA